MNNLPPARIDQIALAYYTAGITRSRMAYNLDVAGLCVECGTRARDGRHSRCWACRREMAA